MSHAALLCLATCAAPLQAGEATRGGLDAFVLTDLVSERLVLEIDWVAGCLPADQALDAAEAFLREHCAPGRRIEIHLDDEIPRAEWETGQDRRGLEALVTRHLDRDPGDWHHAEVVYVLYAPEAAGWYDGRPSGMVDRVVVARGGEAAPAKVAFVFADEVRRDAVLWLSAARVERAVLNHELGHVLGLVASTGHEQRDVPRHCAASRCVMHRPGAADAWSVGVTAVLTGRIPSRLDRQCASDVAEARDRWADRARESPAFVSGLIALRVLESEREVRAWRERTRAP